MKKTSRILALLLAILMLCSLFAGCAKQEETTEDSSSQTTTTESTDATNEEETGAGFDKLDVALFTGGYGDMWSDLLALFQEKYPDCEITADLSSDVAQRVRSRMLTDTPPDVIMISGSNEYNMYEAANSGAYMDMSDFFATGTTDDGDVLSEVIDEEILKAGTIGDALYILPIGNSYSGWWYNQALFDEHGWTVPTTWDEFYELAAEIKATGIEPFAYQGSKATNYIIWGYLYEAVAAAGGYQAYVDAFINLKEGSWTGDAMMTAASNLYNLVQDGYLSKDYVGVEFTQSQIDFVNDRVAMIPCGMWFETEMKDSMPEGFEMAFMAPPMQDSEGYQYVSSTLGTMAVPAKAQNPEAAKAFLSLIYSAEGQKICAKYGQLPVNNSIPMEDIQEYLTPTIQTVYDQVTTGKIKTVTNNPETWYAKMWPTLQDNMTDLILNDITPEEFCNNMEQAVKELREDDSVVKFYID